MATGSKNENGEEIAHEICDVFSTSKAYNEIDRILETQMQSMHSVNVSDHLFPCLLVSVIIRHEVTISLYYHFSLDPNRFLTTNLLREYLRKFQVSTDRCLTSLFTHVCLYIMTI